MSCGRDSASAVSDRYVAPFPFTGELHSVVVDVSGELITDPVAELRTVMARQ
jgi:arylsulfatase